MEDNQLIYGKNPIERIVGIEVKDSIAELFIQKENGEVEIQVVKNKFWLLSDRVYGPGWVKLKGDLYYKYGKQFETKDEWLKEKNRLYSKDLYCIWDEKEQLQVKDGYTYYKGMKPSDPSILSFDIESTGIECNDTSHVVLISNTLRKNGSSTRKLFSYEDYNDEGEMIEAWCDWVRETDPSIIVGHNIYSYDFPYLDYIAKRYGKELLLGRDGSSIKFNKKESKFRVDGGRDQGYKKLRVYGREVLDTLFLSLRYDTATKKYESYALKKIIEQEGLEVKDRQHYDASQIRFNYKNPKEWDKIKKYALHDADDALALYDLMVPAYFYMANAVCKSMQGILESAPGSQINSVLVRSYLQQGHSIPKASEVTPFEGAISAAIPGIYKHCVRWDVSGLYPSIMRQYKVYDKYKDPFGNFLKITEHFAVERLKNKVLAKQTKEKYYEDLQSMQKILANSTYGFLSTNGLNFNSPSNAAFITAKGREILTTAIEHMSGLPFHEWKAMTNE